MPDILHYLTVPPDDSFIYVVTYNPFLVVISILIAIISSYAALKAAERIPYPQDTLSRLIWIGISSFMLGVGIWAMHFIGMLALSLPCGIQYDPFITLWSMIPGILAGGVALGVVWQHGNKHLSPLLSSILLGGGIGTMHYTGMAALRLDGFIRYNLSLFTLSIVVAVALSYVALRIKNSRDLSQGRNILLVAVILGGAVSAMHYTALSATYFMRGDVNSLPTSAFNSNTLAILVAVTTVTLALAALALATISHNREITEQLRESGQRLLEILNVSPIAVRIAAKQGRQVMFCNSSYIDLIKNPRAIGDDPRNYYARPGDYDEVLTEVAQGKVVLDRRIELHIPNGSTVWALASYMPIKYQGEDAVLGWFYDITDLIKAEAEVRIAATAFESQDGMFITDSNAVILRVNSAFMDITGYTAEDVIGKNPRLLSSGRQDANFYSAMWKSIINSGSWGGEIWNRRKNGEIFPERLAITAVKNQNGDVISYVASMSDITQHKKSEEEIQRLAYYDHLTNLPNRRLLMDRLKHALASSNRNRGYGGILFIDLDNFKTLNDTLGHEVGDILLQQVAERLSSSVRDGDTVARLGGDEFVVMLEDLSEQAVEASGQSKVVGEKILNALSRPYQLAAHEYNCTSSIGITMFHAHDQEIEDLLKQADIAMYQAKKAGRNALCFFDSMMQDSINIRAAMETELRNAFENGQFRLHYQIQKTSLHKVFGVEALIRWFHPERGMVSPAQFIPVAEETGLILPIGLWVLETACAQLKAWSKDALTRSLVLAVNVSAKQFHQAGFATQVNDVIKRHAINPNLLKLELTESLLLENTEDAISTMNALSDIGVQISLDDFGTGYSSLQYLKRLPLDQLKIDQSFVRDISVDKSDLAIVHTIITMAHSLYLDVIAEGVETEQQRQLLLDSGCSHYQGFLFGKPMPIDQLEELLKHG